MIWISFLKKKTHSLFECSRFDEECVFFMVLEKITHEIKKYNAIKCIFCYVDNSSTGLHKRKKAECYFLKGKPVKKHGKIGTDSRFLQF